MAEAGGRLREGVGKGRDRHPCVGGGRYFAGRNRNFKLHPGMLKLFSPKWQNGFSLKTCEDFQLVKDPRCEIGGEN